MMFETMQSPEVQNDFGHVTVPVVELIYHMLDLWSFTYSPVQEEVVRCRYLACLINLIWHTDLHQPKDGSAGYYIAFLDDRSRRLMHAEFIEHKTALATKWALRAAIRLTGARPYAVWSDNGTEFKGEFDAYLARQRITHVRTDAYNPEQNGKMERWWPSLEKRPAGVGLQAWVDRYNDHRHKALPWDQTVREAKVHMTPNQAYDLGPIWRPGIPGTWRVNGTVCPFPPGRRASGTRETRPLPDIG
jgi:transposase InsO family protein